LTKINVTINDKISSPCQIIDPSEKESYKHPLFELVPSNDLKILKIKCYEQKITSTSRTKLTALEC
jgi:hypothetical protein